jgi:hypothetical protein
VADDHWELISRALDKKPERRFRDALHLKKRLAEVIPPAPEGEIGALVRERFADRVLQFQKWDSLA